ncbi:MAG: hypothetical protein ACHQRM_03790 [Bacteroidia bacterium]
MKLVFPSLHFLIFSIAGFPQATAPSIPNHSGELLQTMKPIEIHYCCPRCTYSSTQPGICPVHKADLIKEDTYYCTADLTTGKTLHKCPKCGKMMKKMDYNEQKLNKKDSI